MKVHLYLGGGNSNIFFSCFAPMWEKMNPHFDKPLVQGSMGFMVGKLPPKTTNKKTQKMVNSKGNGTPKISVKIQVGEILFHLVRMIH